MPRRGTVAPRLVTRQNKHWTGPSYYIRWHDGGGVRLTATGTGDRGKADKIFARWLLDQEAQGAGLDTSPRHRDEARISDILAAYADQHGPEIKFPERNLYAITRLLDWWKDRMVDTVRPVTCDAYRNARLNQGVKLATITRELACLRAALKWAENNGRLLNAPYVKVPPKQPSKDRFLTRNEAARLLWAARKEPKARLHLPLFIMLGLYTGARSEAILSLKWFPQVDLERGIINYNPPDRDRTTKGRAVVPIPTRVRWFLDRARARSSSAYVLSYHGEPIAQIKHSFKSACLRAGLADVTPHTLRHTCGTWLAQRGVALFQIGGWLGHSYERTTELYAHHHPDHLADARAALDRPHKVVGTR
jgi:integrase